MIPSFFAGCFKNWSPFRVLPCQSCGQVAILTKTGTTTTFDVTGVSSMGFHGCPHFLHIHGGRSSLADLQSLSASFYKYQWEIWPTEELNMTNKRFWRMYFTLLVRDVRFNLTITRWCHPHPPWALSTTSLRPPIGSFMVDLFHPFFIHFLLHSWFLFGSIFLGIETQNEIKNKIWNVHFSKMEP